MDNHTLYQYLVNHFGYQPTEGQAKVLHHLSYFLLSEKSKPTYLLQGYAGTGKTSLVSAIIKSLPLIKMSFSLLAPTGRAAKVLSNYTGKPASTIHRKIYRFAELGEGNIKIIRTENKARNTLFIVDECSMIGDEYRYGGRSLLDDLIEYVFSGKNCKLLFIGDKAQLPPVGTDLSPANDINILKNSFNLTVASFELKEVMRQSLESGVLFNATLIRDKLLNKDCSLPFFHTKDFSDFQRIDPLYFEELLQQNFNSAEASENIIIVRSNKRAVLYNQAIRQRILQEEGEISTGDRLMVVKNNYFWTDKSKEIEFIANGDMIEINKINHFEEMYGFHFADVEIRLTDYPDSSDLSVKILLDTLTSNSPVLTSDESWRLYSAIEEDYMDIPNKRDRYKAMMNNPWYNALLVKFGYALTCHKTQGGQWKNVFIDAPFLPDGETHNITDLRWLYTAVTRAKNKVYLVNFKDDYFEDSEKQQY